MVGMNVFRQDPFTMIELTQAIEKVPYVPDGLEAMGIFTPTPIRTREFWVEERDGKLTIIPFSDRGAPGKQRVTERRRAKAFEVKRIKEEDTIYSHEIANIRDMGQESALMQVQKEVARRTVGPTGLRSLLNYTKEYHRLAAINGYLLDADGSIVYDWFEEFKIDRNGLVPFGLLKKSAGTVRPICAALTRTMQRKARGAFLNSTRIVALCGDAFYDSLVTHPDVEKSYANWTAAPALRVGTAFKDFEFADITWINYRGSDDTVTIACKLTKDSATVKPATTVGLTNGLNISGPYMNADAEISGLDTTAGTFTLPGNFEGDTGTYYLNFGGGASATGGGDIAIPSNKARFFPVGAPGVFSNVMAPAESFEFQGTLGKPEYLRQIPDRDRNEWVKFEMESYPLQICTRPEVLFEASMD